MFGRQQGGEVRIDELSDAIKAAKVAGADIELIASGQKVRGRTRDNIGAGVALV